MNSTHNNTNFEIIQEPSLLSDYFQDETIKNEVTLHATAGTTWYGADLTLDKPDKINVHFGITENAKIIQRFPIENWAYHTGTGSKDKFRIGLEVTTPLLAYKDKNGLWRGYFGKSINGQPLLSKQTYPDSQILHLPPFRGWKDFIMLTREQVYAINWLCLTYIPAQTPWVSETLVYSDHAKLKSTRYDYPTGYLKLCNLSYFV